jgi:lipopolysaccharide/colanic/teichoic acid biosynthesis glycosyltransferase
MYRLDVDRWSTNLTGFQRFLCRSSISELPQLWNVVIGHMSLVGPRPESPERVRAYSDWQRQRLMVKPGMTGLAQVNGLRERHSSDEKARYDLQYIVHWTPVADLLLLLETIWVLVARSWVSDEAQPETPPKSEKRSALSGAATD